MRSYNPPTATYRIQFHAGFTFKQLKEIIPYLHALGISTIYASPVFRATPGSQHGYDVTDPHMINPEIGTIDELREIHQLLQQHDMTWLQDIVPNHMAFHAENTRLYDVMERGPLSPYYHYFDIDWHHPYFAGKLMAPVLGRPVEACIKDHEIKLGIRPDGFTLNYYQQVFPLSVTAYDLIIDQLADSDALPLKKLFSALYQRATAGTSLDEWRNSKRELMAEVKDPGMLQALVDKVNNNAALMTKILAKQDYRLACWSDADRAINYRRFFTVNELITLKMETPEVFNEYHTFLHSLYRENLVQGLRIDHIDGLQDPETYIARLRQLFGGSCYIIAEKILEAQESLPYSWDLQGTSGYEFLAFVNHLLSNQQGVMELREYYNTLVPSVYEDLVLEKKRLILERYMGGEWDNLVRLCYTLKLADARVNRDLLREAIGLFMICLPVYRLYPGPGDVGSNELVAATFAQMRSMNRSAESAILLLEQWWEQHKLPFLMRLMQFTGPLTAKGVEDTTFYVYNALLSHNEVGDSPATVPVNFHQLMIIRQQQTPHALNTTATHDTKRGEDGRMRLNMLTLFAREWKELIGQWRAMNQPGPLLNDEYFIYQSIVSGYFESSPEFIERLQQYIIKALRESKVNSSWSSPDEEYEKKATDFISRVLQSKSFLDTLLPFIEKLDSYAYVASLAQVLVKMTAPGIPDTYQGTELWDYSYVDPDNRRPVDYAVRSSLLNKISGLSGSELFDYLATHRKEGAEKLYLIWKVLHCRKHFPNLFLEGDYLPLQTSAGNVLAFARVYKQEWAVVVIPLPDERPVTASVLLPKGAPVRWKDIFSGERIAIEGAVDVGLVLKRFPVGLLIPENI
ncbi:malto-oligosyltrehalose synthase [Chitinophaga sancti]|uniref:malto-oligosyltrehalose synthase n=1 Tax=Chitinophaga sancti TaxID=1004 RepID=UPI003F7A73E6